MKLFDKIGVRKCNVESKKDKFDPAQLCQCHFPYSTCGKGKNILKFHMTITLTN